MWARIVELMLGIWLAISAFVFGYASENAFLQTSDLVCAALVAVFALGSYRPKMEKIHLLHIGVAAWLIGCAFLRPDPPPAAPYQNYVVTGLLLIMFAVIPSRASQPPHSWEEFMAGEEE